jgi:photosystem II stability/assembly factor-like uncharacterized protein
MKADLSRETFDPHDHYTAVRLQQGRVVTDADFNEQGDLTRHRAERLAEDVIGASGAPVGNAGFALSGGMQALAVHAQDANSIWIAGADGVLLVSANGGAAWTLAATNTTRHLRAVARAANTGWAVGDGGTILRTNNGGTTWTAQASGLLATLRGVAVFDAQRAWAVGDGGLVLRTVDGGTTWTQHAAGTARLYAVAFGSATDGLAVGPGGGILRSTDGGQSWTPVDSTTTATLRAVTVSGAQAWAVGDGGAIVRSSDGGATWAAGTGGGSDALRAVRFRDASVGWAAGDHGALRGTTNGGASWAAVPILGNPALVGVSVAGAEQPWLVGHGSVWRVLATGAGAPTALPAASLLIGAGCFYVQGQHCEWESAASLANQPDGGVPQRLAPGTHLVYLRAWQRHLSCLEAPDIREVALGGPDTATRAQQVAQVRTLPLAEPPDNAGWHCGAAVPDWTALTAAPSARLAARSEPQLGTTGVCDIAASAGYRRLENQLYRVEIHSVDTTTGAATFKWSRENGSVAYAVESVSIDTAANRTTVRVAARGRDANLDLALHDRVELVDDTAELLDRAGQLFEYLNDGDDALELVLAGVPSGVLGQDAGLHPVLRRWDQRPVAAGDHTLAVTEGDWITLEDGVQVRFSPGGNYRPGDHWQVPARTVTADVEWPRDEDGEPVAAPPAGVHDGWARLGLVTVDAGGLVSDIVDCRDLFPPLTKMTQLLYVGGDGQDTTPGGNLAEPLRVRVARGALPVPGARVRFTVEAGAGTLTLVAPWGSQTGNAVDALCDAQGVAQCNWRLGTPQAQRVRAQLLTTGGTVVPEQQAVFAAKAATPAQGTGTRGCEITIGEGGDFPALNTALLAKLLEAGEPALCICFMPGRHQLEGLQIAAERTRTARLSLHGCGATALVTVTAPIALGGFAALEIRDLVLGLQPRAGLALNANADLRLTNLQIGGRGAAGVRVEGAGDVRMAGCEIAAAAPASLLLEGITGLCEIVGNRILGDVALYGDPADGVISRLIDRLLGGGFEVPPGSGTGRLVFSQNQLPRMLLGKALVDPLAQGQVADALKGAFQSVVLHGNTFTGHNSLCAGALVSCTGNIFTAGTAQERVFYGAVVCGAAAASGNVGTVFGDICPLVFLAPKGNTFRGAANMVFTLPQSTG